VTVLTAALVAGTAAAAQAHVHVGSDSNVVGTDATLTFRVPTESTSASTVKVVVTLPTDPPLLSVAPGVVPGWSATVSAAALPHPVVVSGTTLTTAPHLVTWTAVSGGIPPEQFAQFPLLVENLPDTALLRFPTTQYYSDGTVVSWTQPIIAGAPGPDHPVPTLALVRAAPVTPAPQDGAGDGMARWLSAAALAVALLALALATATGRVGRRAVRAT